jgi:hypothetical protein
MESPENLPVPTAILLEGILEKFQFLVETVQVADGFGCMYQGGKHNLLVCWMMVRPDIQTEVGMGGLPVYSVSQGAIWSPVYTNIYEGRWPSVSMMYAVEVEEVSQFLWSIGPEREGVVNISEPAEALQVTLLNVSSSKILHEEVGNIK